MPSKKMLERESRIWNKMADQNEGLGISRKDIFDDGARTSRDSAIKDRGYQQDWPDHMKEHFKAQDSVNQMMEDKANAALDDYEEDI
jgi:hypothetical protein